MNLNEEIARAYPEFPVVAGAREVAAAAVEKQKARYRRGRQIRRSVLGGLATCGAIALFVGVGPTAWAVYRLHQIAGVMSDVKSAEIDQYRLGKDGRLTPSGRVLYQSGNWRFENGAGFRIWSQGKMWAYEPELKRATVKAMPDGPATYNTTGFGIQAMISSMASWSWKQKIEVGDGTFEGKEVTQVTLTNSNGADRVIVYADKSTEMPIAFQNEGQGSDGWHPVGLARFAFDKPLPQEEFVPKFASGVAIVDLDKEQREFVDQLQSPITSFKADGYKIDVRRVDINPNGDLFVLYTDGETYAQHHQQTLETLSMPRDGRSHVMRSRFFFHPTIEVTDSAGAKYLSTSSLQPFMDGPSAKFKRGIILKNGEVLEGASFVPPTWNGWRPVSLTIKFQNEPYKVSFTKPTAGLDPDWMPLMGMGPRGQEDVLMDELAARRPELMQGSDMQALINNLNADLKLKEQEEAKGVGPWARGEDYFGLYQAYLRLNDERSAKYYLRLAAREPYPTPMLKEALARYPNL